MTRNKFQDNRVESAVGYNATDNAHNEEGILNGCDPSKGSGDFDVDVASGDALVQGTEAAVSAQTETLDTSDSDDRVDLVHVDSTGTVSHTTGTPATDPVAPDIPAGEVLIAAVLVEGGASSLNSAGSRIADYRTITVKAGEDRFDATASATIVEDEQDQDAIELNDGTHYRYFARSETPLEIRDAALGGLAASYTAGASKPNTWDFNGHDLSGINALTIDKLVIGGTLFVEDGNSPLNVSGVSSTTYTMATNSDHVVVLTDHGNYAGFDQAQVNGDTGANYSYVDNTGTKTTGASELDFVEKLEFYDHFEIFAGNNNKIVLTVGSAAAATDFLTGGSNSNVSAPVSQFTLKDAGGTNREYKARVYRRVMSV